MRVKNMNEENENSVNTEDVATSDNNNSAIDPLDELLIIEDDEIVEDEEDESDADAQNDENQEINFDSKAQSRDKNNEANSQFAKMRRENEELKKKQDIANKYLSNLYKEQGIENIDGFNSYMQNFEETQKKAEYEAKGIDIDAIDKVIAERLKNNPELQKLQKMEEDRKIQLEVQEFENNYPQYQNAKNIQDLPNYEKVLELRSKHNLSLTDAFTIANKDKLNEIYKKEALDMKNKIKTDLVAKQNKNISNTSGSNGSNPIVITKSDLKNWKNFYPNKSDDELKKMIYKAKTRN